MNTINANIKNFIKEGWSNLKEVSDYMSTMYVDLDNPDYNVENELPLMMLLLAEVYGINEFTVIADGKTLKNKGANAPIIKLVKRLYMEKFGKFAVLPQLEVEHANHYVSCRFVVNNFLTDNKDYTADSYSWRFDPLDFSDLNEFFKYRKAA